MTKEQISLDRFAPTAARRIAKRLVDAALAAGYAISVFDGEETTVRKSTERSTILAAMATTSEDVLTLWQGGDRIGNVWLIYSNDEDVVSDWSENEAMNAFMEPFLD
jgi:hypothetical protein